MVEARGEHPRATTRQIFNEALRRLLDRLVSGLVAGTKQSVEQASVKTPEEVRLCPRRLAALTPEAARASGQLVQLLQGKVYRSEEINQAVSRPVTRWLHFLNFSCPAPKRYRPHTASGPNTSLRSGLFASILPA